MVAVKSPQPRWESHRAAELFPLMSEEELGALAEDIKANGLRQPVVMYQGKVLDGRNRLLACQRAGVEPRFEDWPGTGSPTAWVVSQNLHRRHLTDTQRKVISVEATKLYYEEDARNRQRKAGGDRRSPSADLREAIAGKGKAVARAARDLGVSVRGVEQAKRVSEKAPVLKEAVLAGVASLDAAAVLADEPEARQRETVAAGPKAIKEAAKAKRQQKKSRKEVSKVAPPRNGLQFARMAIRDMQQIRKDDVERKPAFQLMRDWMEANQ